MSERSDRIAELQAYLDGPPIACACIGPGPDSRPGECRCLTAWRRVREQLDELVRQEAAGDS